MLHSIPGIAFLLKSDRRLRRNVQSSMVYKSLRSSKSTFLQTGGYRNTYPIENCKINRSRYDMLCFEGISLVLNIFNSRRPMPNYRLVAPANGNYHTITVHEEVDLHVCSDSEKMLISFCRPLKSGPSSRVLYFAMFSLIRLDMTRSLPSRKNFIKILPVSGHLYQLAPTT